MSVMLRPLAEVWDRGVPPKPVRWVVRSSGVGLLVAALAWVVMPFLALGHQVPVESIERTTWASMVIAPTMYAFVFLVPVAAHWHLGRTLKALSIGVMTSIAVGAASFEVVDAASKVVAAGAGQLVTLLWLLSVFRRPRAKGSEVDRRAVTPSV